MSQFAPETLFADNKSASEVTAMTDVHSAKKSKVTPAPAPAKDPVLVINSRDTGLDNYPFSVERAGQLLKDYLTDMRQKGYKFGGTISRDVGTESREFYVFYLSE